MNNLAGFFISMF